jgi:hypothetical protein
MTNGNFVTVTGDERVAGVTDLPFRVTVEKTVELRGITSFIFVHSNEKKMFLYFQIDPTFNLLSPGVVVPIVFVLTVVVLAKK